MENTINFGESLTELLGRKNVTVERLANAIGVSLPTLYDWKRNEQDIKLSNLNLIANYFHCSFEFLIGRSNDESFVEEKFLSHFGQRLRFIMKKLNITTYKMRQKGYGSKHFENWDKGADPFLATLIELSFIFDCTIDYLTGR